MSHWFKRIVWPQVFIEEKTAMQARGLATGLDVTLLATVTLMLLLAALRQPVWAAALLLEALVWEGGSLIAARYSNIHLASMHFTTAFLAGTFLH